jgi:choline dehydrogenase-like flavoprotein
MIVHGRDLTSDLALDVDAVVIGTGAGGGMALRELARAGLKAIALEEGAHHTPRDFNQREDDMIPMLFQDAGARTTRDLAIRVLQGRGVGGSTIHNTNLCKRTPDDILDLWRDRYAVTGASPAEMVADFERVERDLSVTEIPAALRNPNNEALHVGARELGWKAGPLKHNRVGCQLSGFCELGCAYDAKQNVPKVLLPQAEAAGATVYSDVEVLRIVHEKGHVTGVLAAAHDGRGGPRAWIRVKAPIVVLAASAVGSATLAIKSNLPDPFEQVGRGLRLHPGAVVAGRFDRVMNSQYGIPQSYECTEFLSYEEGSDARVWIVPAFAHPIGTASMLPGFGKEHMRAMRTYGNLAVLTAMLHDETAGRVTVDANERPSIEYEMIERDRAALAKGLVACARLLFAAGAAEVVIPAIPPVRLKSASELDALKMDFVQPHAVPLTAVHPMGTLRMGDDPKLAVVDSHGEHHFVKGLYVADGSLFPTSLGAPPQISIYTFAMRIAKHAAASR